MTVNSDPFPALEMAMISFYEPMCFRTTRKWKKVAKQVLQPEFGSAESIQGDEHVDKISVFDRLAKNDGHIKKSKGHSPRENEGIESRRPTTKETKKVYRSKSMSTLEAWIITPSQNINKNWSLKVNVFDSKFVSNTSTYVNSFLLTFWYGRSIS